MSKKTCTRTDIHGSVGLEPILLARCTAQSPRQPSWADQMYDLVYHCNDIVLVIREQSRAEQSVFWMRTYVTCSLSLRRHYLLTPLRRHYLLTPLRRHLGANVDGESMRLWGVCSGGDGRVGYDMAGGKKLVKRSEDKAKRCEAMRSDAKRLSACGEGRLFKKALSKWPLNTRARARARADYRRLVALTSKQPPPSSRRFV